MFVKKFRISSILFCLGISLSTLAMPTHANTPQSLQEQPMGVLKTRLTSCPNLSRVKSMTNPSTVKLPTQTQGDQTPPQNSTEDQLTETPLSARPRQGGQIVPVPPDDEIPILEEVTDPLTVTVTTDGGVKVEGSGTLAPKEKRRAALYEVNLAKCSVAFRYATFDEQKKLDDQQKLRNQQFPTSEPSSNLVGTTKLAKPAMQFGGIASFGIRLITYDPVYIPLAESMQRISWGWANGSINYVGGGYGYCYAYQPSAGGTWWNNSYCQPIGTINYGSSAYSSRQATYWNNNFIECRIQGGTAYSSHYIALYGYVNGYSGYYWSESHYGAPCSQRIFGLAYFA
jgi:hypothetical protein